MKQIDKGVPLPRISRGRTPMKYPWEVMEVGDSFLVDRNGKQTSSVTGQVSLAGRRYGRKFTCRKTLEGYRVWRVE